MSKSQRGGRSNVGVYDDAMFHPHYHDDIEALPICQNQLFDDDTMQKLIEEINSFCGMSFTFTPEDIERIRKDCDQQCQN